LALWAPASAADHVDVDRTVEARADVTCICGKNR
jgi:hypothetical protein